MFKSIKRTIRFLFYRKLFLRIYFIYLKNDARHNSINPLGEALYDTNTIKRVLSFKPLKKKAKN